MRTSRSVSSVGAGIRCRAHFRRHFSTSSTLTSVKPKAPSASHSHSAFGRAGTLSITRVVPIKNELISTYAVSSLSSSSSAVSSSSSSLSAGLTAADSASIIPNGNTDTRITAVPHIAVLPFVNREYEIARMTAIFIFNLLKRRTDNTNKYKLLVAAQMWGSGKSAIAENYIKQINAPGPPTSPLSRLVGGFNAEQRETFKQLQSAIYVQIDLSAVSGGPLKHFLVNRVWQYVRTNVVEALKDTRKQMTAEQAADYTSVIADIEQLQESGSELFTAIVDLVRARLNRTLYLHFDEIDALEMFDREDEVNGRDGSNVGNYYDFWRTVLMALFKAAKVPFILTGRTPWLYFIGRRSIKVDGRSLSPCVCECFILDTLHEDHVKQIIETMFKDKIPADSDEWRMIPKLANKIVERTGGVPRFVQYAVFILQNHMGHWSIELFGQPLVDCIKEYAMDELMPWDDLLQDDQARDALMTMMKMAALKIPLQPGTVMPLPSSSPSISRGPLDYNRTAFTLVKQLNMYIYSKTNVQQSARTKDTFVILLPAVCMEALREVGGVDWIYQSALRVFDWIDLTHSRDPSFDFELMIARAVQLRLAESLLHTSRSISEALPFLSGSIVHDQKVRTRITAPNPIARFVKIVMDKRQTHVDEDKQKRIVECLTGDTDFTVECPASQWAFLLQQMERDIVYLAASESHSADFLALLQVNNSQSNLCLLEAQMKMIAEPLTMNDVAVEYGKSAVMYVPVDNGSHAGAHYSFVFLIVTSGPISEQVKELGKSVKSVDGNQIIAYRFNGSKKFTKRDTNNATVEETLDVPVNSEIIVLTNKTVDELVGPSLRQFIEKQTR